MKTIFKITVFLLFFAGSKTSCKELEENYPKEIPFTEYSLPEGCGWDVLVPDSLYLINSQEVLPVFCLTNVFLDVDLDKYSLIVLQPSYCNIDSKVEKLGLQQVSPSKYLFTADITPSVTANATPLVISVLVPKISDEAIVTLNVIKEPTTIPYEMCTHEGEYMDTILVEGTGYLFIDSIPARLQKDNNVMYIIYNKEDNLTAFSYSGTYESSSAFYNGNICNFPDFAKEWEIPFEGRQIHYKGDLYSKVINLRNC